MKAKYSKADYLLLPEGAAYQLIKGEIINYPSSSLSHQKLLGLLFLQMQNYCSYKNCGEVFLRPFDVYLDEENIFQPDILFISSDDLSLIEEDGVKGAPSLVIELVSHFSAYYDFISKLQLYEKYGVKEYFIVDPEDNMVIAYALSNSRYKEIYREPKKIESVILGTTISW